MTILFSASPSLADSVDFPAAILPHIMCRVAFEAAIGKSLKGWEDRQHGGSDRAGSDHAGITRGLLPSLICLALLLSPVGNRSRRCKLSLRRKLRPFAVLDDQRLRAVAAHKVERAALVA
jgi:hypothetical protein